MNASRWRRPGCQPGRYCTASVYHPSPLSREGASGGRRATALPHRRRVEARRRVVGPPDAGDGYLLAHLPPPRWRCTTTRDRVGFVRPHFAFRGTGPADYLDGIKGNAGLPLIDDVPRATAHRHLGADAVPGHRVVGDRELVVGVPRHPARPRPDPRRDPDEGGHIVSGWAFTRQTARSAGNWASHIRGKFDGDAAADPLASGDFMAEDVYTCEQQQKCLRSPYFEHGPSCRRGEWRTAREPPVSRRFASPPPRPKTLRAASVRFDVPPAPADAFRWRAGSTSRYGSRSMAGRRAALSRGRAAGRASPAASGSRRGPAAPAKVGMLLRRRFSARGSASGAGEPAVGEGLGAGLLEGDEGEAAEPELAVVRAGGR